MENYKLLPHDETISVKKKVKFNDQFTPMKTNICNLAESKLSIYSTKSPIEKLENLFSNNKKKNHCYLSEAFNLNDFELTNKEKLNDKLVREETLQHIQALENYLTAAVSKEPTSYQQAVNSREKDQWLCAIEKEKESLLSNKTWIECKLPTGRKSLPCQWLFKIKYLADGTVDKYKARLVVQGNRQKESIDYNEIFAPVLRLESLRLLLAIATANNLECDQMDI